MKKAITLATIAATISLVGCKYTPLPNGPVNANPISAITGGFNPPILNGEAITLSFSQLRSFGTLDVVGPGISLHIGKNMPSGYVDQPVSPLTTNEIALVEQAFIANTIYGMRNDHSSWDVILTPAVGWNVTLHTAYPPSTLNGQMVTNLVVTPPITNSVVSQVIKQ